MTSREIVTTLLNKQIPERMGCFDHWWPETIPDYWSKQGYPEGVDPEAYFDYDMSYCGGWFDTEPFRGQSAVVDETDEWRVVRDGRGASLKYWKHKSGTPEHMAFEVESPEVWKRYREPLLEFDPDRLGDTESVKAKVIQAKEKGKYSFFGHILYFEHMRNTMGDMVFLPALLEEPDWIRDFCQVHFDFMTRHLDAFFARTGVPDGFFVYEDLGYTNGLFCSPASLKELYFPYVKRFVAFLKDYGMQVILHTCGDVRMAVPMILDAGYDCLQPMEAKAGNHVVEFARTYGNSIAYMGNIDVTVLGTGDRNAIHEEVVGKVAALRELRVPYFFHSDHSVPPTVRFQDYEYAIELFRSHSRY